MKSLKRCRQYKFNAVVQSGVHATVVCTSTTRSNTGRAQLVRWSIAMIGVGNLETHELVNYTSKIEHNATNRTNSTGEYGVLIRLCRVFLRVPIRGTCLGFLLVYILPKHVQTLLFTCLFYKFVIETYGYVLDNRYTLKHRLFRTVCVHFMISILKYRK